MATNRGLTLLSSGDLFSYLFDKESGMKGKVKRKLVKCGNIQIKKRKEEGKKQETVNYIPVVCCI